MAYATVLSVQSATFEESLVNPEAILTSATNPIGFDTLDNQQSYQSYLLDQASINPSLALEPLTCYKAPVLSSKLNIEEDSQQIISQATGVLLHRMLEYILRHGINPSVSAVASWAIPLGLTQAQVYHLNEQCQQMVQITQLTELIQSSTECHVALEEDIYISATGQVIRPDVVVYYSSNDNNKNHHQLVKTSNLNAWVIDFKLSFDVNTEQANAYAAQLRSYVLALRAASLMTVNAYLLTLAGECWRFDGLNTSSNSTVDLAVNPWQLCTAPWVQPS
jgi:hypothetical protein